MNGPKPYVDTYHCIPCDHYWPFLMSFRSACPDCHGPVVTDRVEAGTVMMTHAAAAELKEQFRVRDIRRDAFDRYYEKREQQRAEAAAAELQVELDQWTSQAV